MSRAFNPERHCGAASKRCTTDPPTCRHADGIHACRRGKGWATDHPGFGHCMWHFGRAANHIKQAQREQAEQAIAKLGVAAGSGDPFKLLTKAIRHAEGYLDSSASVLVEVVDKTRTDVPLDGAIAGYVRGIREAARTAKMAVDADFLSSLAAVDKQMGAIIHRVLSAALDASGVAGPGRAAAEAVMARELLAAGPIGDERN
jgi:hypothetical protein